MNTYPPGFKHSHQLAVRNYEIDWQGIVHNANYLLYFETARIEYFKKVGMEIDERSITGKTKIVVVRNELDYLGQATFGDLLTVFTRISAVKTSSILCDAAMMNSDNMTEVARNRCVLVWLDPATNKSMSVPDYFRKKVEQFEGSNASVLWPNIET